MFARETYIQRRERLKAQVSSGLILLLGNEESPMNYAANTYPFRQDSTFLYFFGLDQPGLAAVIDVEEGTECVFGDDPTVEEIVWTGPVPLLRDRCSRVGVTQTAPSDKLQQVLNEAARQGRTIHFPPQYRAENTPEDQSVVEPEGSSCAFAGAHPGGCSAAIDQVGGGDRADRGGPGYLPADAHHRDADGPAGRRRAGSGGGDGRASRYPMACDWRIPPSSPPTARRCTILIMKTS